MEKYTLKPIAQLFRLQPRATYTHNDIVQLEAQWMRSPPVGTAALREIYCTALGKLKRRCPPGKKITKAQVIEAVDQFVREQGLYFRVRRKKSARDNFFMPVAENLESRYDLAFFNSSCRAERETHHVLNENNSPEELKTAIKKNLIKLLTAPGATPENVIQKTDQMVEAAYARHPVETIEELPGVCYVRCEEFDQIILIGNMQMDAQVPGTDWRSPGLGATLGKARNTYKAMVQEALKHALNTGKPRIIFQGGYANYLTQWGDSSDDFTGRELITAENLVMHQERYKTWQRQVAALTPGTIIYRPHPQDYSELERRVVVHHTAKSIHSFYEDYNFLVPLVYTLTGWEGFRAGITSDTVRADHNKTLNTFGLSRELINSRNYSGYPNYISELAQHLDFSQIQENTLMDKFWDKKASPEQEKHHVHTSFYVDLTYAYINKDAAGMLTAINKIFDYLLKIDFTAQLKSKMSYLEKLLETGPKYPGEYIARTPRPPRFHGGQGGLGYPGHFPAPEKERKMLYEIIEEFLYKFNYHKLLLAKFRNLRMVTKEDQHPGIYDPARDVTVLKMMPPPAIGDLAPKTFKYPATAAPCYPVYHPGPIHNWYEKTLPKIFKELNLTIKRTHIVSQKTKSKYATAYGWEITTPPEELRSRQIISV